ncbi:DNA polymerase eta [Zea mays]|uniref:DNA polymerase eta n=1 Tax=Zea mays TaxID=4577 RepID=A0A1D6LTC7_MAIZE|nr:DNA polymerase eta [Zea mays]
MRGDEAKRVCPGINLVQVPVARGKADLNLYRSAGAEVVAILASKGKCERASIDEVYLDLTDAAKEMLLQAPPDSPEGIFMEAAKSNILGLPADASEKEKNVRAWLCQSEADYQDKLLTCGAIIVAQLRVRVLEETQFTCSAGIAHNKMLAKLVSGMRKPAQQTVVPSSSVQDLLASLPVKKMYHVHEKITNFMAPEPMVLPPMAPKLFENLFGNSS